MVLQLSFVLRPYSYTKRRETVEKKEYTTKGQKCALGAAAREDAREARSMHFHCGAPATKTKKPLVM
jgi:hypothetical protein